ncbi:MAG: Mrp/NBP35 family ATP-binding protein [Hyphomicrobiales bacterium]
MPTLEREDILAALKSIRLPGHDRDIVAEGLVSAVSIRDGQVIFAITVDPKEARALEPVRKAAEQAVTKLSGVKRAIVALTAEAEPGSGAPRPQRPASGPQAGGPRAAGAPVPGVRHIVAVASGKGGVGKSTTAVNLALALSAIGVRTGILDADIYGPSLPRLLAITEKPQAEAPGSRILKPIEKLGLKVMSIGFLVEENTAMIWRGPMVMSALQQMLREVAWGDLDVLVVDMPPGTGDAQLTLAQQTPLSGAVIVSTPQDLALVDARRGIAMFRKVAVPILGIVENMSYFVCPDCGGRHDIFGHGGAHAEAAKLGVPFLGEVPLDPVLRERSDAGEPIVAAEPASPHTAVYLEMARMVWQSISADSVGRKPPKIVYE